MHKNVIKLWYVIQKEKKLTGKLEARKLSESTIGPQDTTFVKASGGNDDRDTIEGLCKQLNFRCFINIHANIAINSREVASDRL